MTDRESEARQRAAMLQVLAYDHSFLDAPAEPIKPVSPNDLQVGGDHYKKMAIQPWDVIEANGYDFWEGSALSYLMRWRAKGGVADLEKAKHYIDKMIELETKKGLENPV